LRGVRGRGIVTPCAPCSGIVVVIPDGRLLGEVRPLRTTGDTTLGGDHDDAVRSVRSVQRCGGRSTNHFHGLDLVRVQVADAAGGAAAHAYGRRTRGALRSEEHTSELQSRENLVCRLLLEKKK